jgi:hypothetical protein
MVGPVSRLSAQYPAFLQRNLKIGHFKLEELIDDSIVRGLDKSGCFERIAEYGVK